MDVNEWLRIVFRKHSFSQPVKAIFKLGFLFDKQRSYHIYNVTPASVAGNSLYYLQVKVIPYCNGSSKFRVQRLLFWPELTHTVVATVPQNSYVKMDFSEKMTGGVLSNDYKSLATFNINLEENI